MYLGVARLILMMAWSMVFHTFAISQPVNNFLYRNENGMDNTTIAFSERSIFINYSLSELKYNNLDLPEGKFYRVTIPGHTLSTTPGKPELPVLSRIISIPEGSSFRIRISEVKSSILKPERNMADGVLYPAQEGETKTPQRQVREFKMDRESYSSRGLLKTDTVSIVPLGKARQMNLANIMINPVRYNPLKNQLEIISSMKIEVIFTEQVNAGTKSSFSGSSAFEQVLGKGILNFDQDDLIPGYSDKPVRMIILTDTAFQKHIDPFIRWKTQKGFKTEVLYKGAAFAGENYTELRNSIKTIYNSSTDINPAPEFLLIIGDVSKIPYYGTGQVTDMYYGEFTGNGDYIPEMFIGRLPVKDTTELKSVLNKLIQYEKFEFADTNRFYSNAITTTGTDASYATYLDGQVKYGINYYLNSSNKINESHFYTSYVPSSAFAASKKDSIFKLINKGTSFINYSGHGSTSAWLHLNISVSDTSKLTNRNMYPFIISNACQTSRYSTSSLGNVLVKARNKGAIGFIGCSNDSYWDEDFHWAIGLGTPSSDPKYETTGLGAFDRLFHTHGEKASDWYITMGQVIYAGNLAVSASTSSRKKYYWETYNLVGDPSIIPFIGTPDTFNISLPDTLPNNLNTLSLIAEPYSYVAVSHFDTLWDASHVSPSGSVTLNLPGLSNDSCLVVITGQNRKPLIKTIYFSEIYSPYINLTKTEINDGSGNNNGLADFGETIDLDLTIRNLGMAGASNLRALLVSKSDWITLNTDSVHIGTLAGNSEIVLDNGLSFTIDKNIPDKGIVTLEIILRDDNEEKHFLIDITIHAPILTILSCRLDDSVTGNDDYVADPGENIQLVFQILNRGSSNTSGQFTVASAQSEITLPEPSIKSGTLQFGDTTVIVIQAKISEDAIQGSTVSISSLIDCSPYINERTFTFRIGRVRESFESESFRVFPWINISPKPWIITESTSVDGGFSARSGLMSHASSSSLLIRTKYEKADSLRFFYKVSSEASYDFFSFRLNGTEVFKKSGEIAWTRKAVAVPKGYNTMEWIYRKDESVSSGTDCAMIDMIDFSGNSSVSYITRDLVSAKLMSPVQKDDLNMEEITVKVVNTGADTINGFNMAYRINNTTPVRESFKNILIPYGDTATVTFATKVNLWYFGSYNIDVYSLDNNDDYLLNDSLHVLILNSDSLRININEPVIIQSVTAYPNPASDKIHVKIYALSGGKVHALLTSLTGRKYEDQQFILTPGENIFTMDISRMPSSLYFLSIESREFRKTITVIKTHK